MTAKNQQVRVLASAARTASINSPDMRNARHQGVRVHINVTAADATPSVVFKIQGKDNLTGDYFDMLSSAAVTAIGDTYLHIYPGIAAAANSALSAVLPSWWRVVATAGDADALTYEVTADLLG
jgi:hypothetical protein